MPKRLIVPDGLPEPKKPETTLAAENARFLRLYLERIALKFDRLAMTRTGSYRTCFSAAAKIVRDAKPD